MTEQRVGFLYRLSSNITTINSKCKSSRSLELLKSYYLLRCHELTKSYSLPSKQFSSKLRCSHCCTEWRPNKYVAKIKPNKRKVILKEDQIKSTIMERTCLLCMKSTNIMVDNLNEMEAAKDFFTKPQKTDNTVLTSTKDNSNKNSAKIMKERNTSVYCNTSDVFSLKNKDNDIVPTNASIGKVIKNNKRKKDKFAGLCKEAVLSAAKMANDQKNKNKLNLFLKPTK